VPLTLFLSEDGDTNTYQSDTRYRIRKDGNGNIHWCEKPSLIESYRIIQILEHSSPEVYHA